MESQAKAEFVPSVPRPDTRLLPFLSKGLREGDAVDACAFPPRPLSLIILIMGALIASFRFRSAPENLILTSRAPIMNIFTNWGGGG